MAVRWKWWLSLPNSKLLYQSDSVLFDKGGEAKGITYLNDK